MSLQSLNSQQEEWEREQAEVRAKVISYDTEPWQKSRSVGTDGLKYVAGLDISYVKDEEDQDGANRGCAALVVCELPTLKVVYSCTEMTEIDVPYIPGFLSFHEAPFLIGLYRRLLSESPKFLPQAVLIDGNGLLHSRECGLACHVGVTLEVPTVGVAKNLFHVDGIAKDEKHKDKIKHLESKGDHFPLTQNSGKVLGMVVLKFSLALKTCKNATNPVYVSVGHKISLESAVWLVDACSTTFRIPEPIRQADMLSREILRDLAVQKRKV